MLYVINEHKTVVVIFSSILNNNGLNDICLLEWLLAKVYIDKIILLAEYKLYNWSTIFMDVGKRLSIQFISNHLLRTQIT